MTPILSNRPMWLRRVGFFLADIGNWIAGYDWGADLYWRGVTDAVKHPDDARAFVENDGTN